MATARGWPVLAFSRPVSLRDRIPAPSGAAVATTAAVGISALAAGALTYSLLRRFAFCSGASKLSESRIGINSAFTTIEPLL